MTIASVTELNWTGLDWTAATLQCIAVQLRPHSTTPTSTPTRTREDPCEDVGVDVNARGLAAQQTFLVDEYVFGNGNARLGGDDSSNGDVAQLRKLPDGDRQLAADLSRTDLFHVVYTAQTTTCRSERHRTSNDL